MYSVVPVPPTNKMITGKRKISDTFNSGVTPQVFHVLGAFDRFNYGDVLFAQISRQLIMDEFPGAQIAFYGTHRSDLAEMGGGANEAYASPLSRDWPADSARQECHHGGRR